MDHLSLEIFDLDMADGTRSTSSKYANLPDDASITITDTSEIFSSGDVWSHSFKLSVLANAHIFGTSSDLHGSRLHEQINKRRARLWVEGLPLFLGYLLLDDETEVDRDGNVEVRFESGQKTFDEMIAGTSAREVSVGDDVVIGVALNRKRVSVVDESTTVMFTLNGLEVYAAKDPQLDDVKNKSYSYGPNEDPSKQTQFRGSLSGKTPYVQRWPKLVKSRGEVLDSSGEAMTVDYTNIQTPYDAAHPFCNINICYPLKVNDKGEEKADRGYTLRLAHSNADTTDGGDGQTRFNNSPNFYLLYFIDRLFHDLGIHVMENQAKNVEDLRRVFMLNYGCHYEEIEDSYEDDEINVHTTPRLQLPRYGQYYMQIIRKSDQYSLLKGWDSAGEYCYVEPKSIDHKGKVLLRDVVVEKNGEEIFSAGSVEGVVQSAEMLFDGVGYFEDKDVMKLDRTEIERPEKKVGFYSSYLAYATGDNYPNVEISEIIDAMKQMFGVRFLFNDDYSTVRIMLLRDIFRSTDVQHIACDIVDAPERKENSIRGFRMTYGKGTDDTSFYYKGFADLFSRAAKTWQDTTDKHDYSQWKLTSSYDEIKQYVSAFNRRCYVTPVNGNAYGTQVDEDEDVLFPSLFEWAGFMDAEDGDCSGEPSTIKEVQCGATPVLMNDVNNAYASLFSGDLKAPAPDIIGSSDSEIAACWSYVSWLATYGRVTPASLPVSYRVGSLTVTGNLDIYLAEGFRIRLLDNYAISNGGTPFDESDPGLCFGIMRGSGDDAFIRYFDDSDDGEGNDTWEVEPGSGAISHPDTCDGHGNEWDYNGSGSLTSEEAERRIRILYPATATAILAVRSATKQEARNAGWFISESTPDAIAYLYHHMTYRSAVDGAIEIYCTPIKWGNVPSGQSRVFTRGQLESYITELCNHYGWRDFTRYDSYKVVFAVNPSDWNTLASLRAAYFGYDQRHDLDNGLGATDGRFSLKLRAEKLNPYYRRDVDGNPYHDRYLPITKASLCRRGLADQFYLDYSYFVLNARTVKWPVHMELAQLLSIDKTKRVTVGDVTGFIITMEYTVSKESGLGLVIMEIMYI
ncbi:MAG: hypothetical protein K6B13_08200 [Prevotella sp.]|nr:hypothetical protein [Prevotella sp.]